MFHHLVMGLLIVAGVSLVSEVRGSRGSTVKWTGGSSIAWPSSTAKSIYQKTGSYVGKNMLATRAAIYNNQAIVTIPRLKHGTAITLGKINLKSRTCPPSLKAFPCWAQQEEGNCEALQNAVDLFLDSNDILWILDTGVVNTFENPIRRCPPKVVAFNMETQNTVRSIDLTPLTTESSRLQYLVADYDPEDHRPFLYIADADAQAILVHDVASGRSHRVLLPPEVTNGCAERDVLYAALYRPSDGRSSLVFTYLCGERLYSIGTEFLRSGDVHGRIQHLGVKTGPIVMLGTDNGGALFFRKEGEAAIYRWDLEECAGPEEAQLVREGGDCLLPTHVAADYKRERMRVLESNFPDFFKGTVGCGVDHSLDLL